MQNRNSIVVLCALALSGTARAEPVQPLDGLRRSAEEFVLAQLDGTRTVARSYAQAGSLDERLRLAPCATAPQAFLPQGARLAARTMIGVRCAQAGWTVYVPVNVETQLPVLVLQRAAARNAALSTADVALTTRRVQGFAADYVSDTGALAGRHLKNAATPGTPLTAAMLAPDVLIRRGQRVTLLASSGNFEVRALGEAVADATALGRVRVLNLASRRIVEGQVENANLVRVQP